MTAQNPSHAAPHDPRPIGPGGKRRALALAAVLAIALALGAGIVALSRIAHVRAGGSASATTAGSAGAGGAVRVATASAALGELRVSRDFGATTLRERRLAIPPGATAMSVLAENAKVDSAYGGGFVNAIDGLSSGFTGTGGVRADWFYFVDGLQAATGATDRVLAAGDREWWDYHRWDFAPSVPAVVGQFPQPFLASDASTRVAYSPDCRAQAEAVVSALRAAGVARVSATALDASSALSGDGHTVLVGTWRELATLPTIRDAAEHPASSGFFARFDAAGLVTLDALGRPTAHGVPAGAVLATALAEKPAAAIWLVTGAEPADVAAAAQRLADGAPQLEGRFGVAVLRDGSALALPTAAPR